MSYLTGFKIVYLYIIFRINFDLHQELFLNASLATNLVKENVDVVYGCLGGDDMRHRLV